MDRRWQFTFAGGYPFAAVSVLAVSIVLLPIRGLISPATAMLVYVPVIVAVARLAGARASAVAALLSFLAADLLLVPPYYQLTVDTPTEWIALVVFLLVALVAGQQTARLREREGGALRRQAELELLNRLSFRIVSQTSSAATAEFVSTQLAKVLSARRVAVYALPEPGEDPVSIASAGGQIPLAEEPAFVGWVTETGKAVGMPPAESVPLDQRFVAVAADAAIAGTTASAAYLPLLTASNIEGVLVVVPGEEPLAADDARVLSAAANLAAASLSRTRLENETARAAAAAEADRLKSTLVSSVSHELKTPLAAATARVTGLLEEDGDLAPAHIREELTDIADDLSRLNGSIGDLLDLSRLESDSWRPSAEEQDVADILGTVLSRVPSGWRSRVKFDLAVDLPALHADFGQLARALLHVVDNALLYSPPDSTVYVATRWADDAILITVEDQGPGVPDAEKERIFEKFQRGSSSASVPGGTGLGLAIASEIVRSNGGTMWVEDAKPHGARFVIAFPAPKETSE